MSLSGISKTLVAVVILVILIVAVVAVYVLKAPPAPTPTTPVTSPSPSPTPTTPTPTPTTPVSPTPTPTPTTPSPTPTTPAFKTITIGNVEIRVPEDFASFVEKAKRKEVSVTIYFGHALAPEERPAFEKVINMFMQEYPGIVVSILAYGGMGDLQSRVSATAALPKEQRETLIGNAPDVFTWAHDWVGWMADAGYLVALEDYVGYDAVDDVSEYILPVALSAVTYGGKTYGLPYAGEALALFVNTKLVPKPPETFNELLAIMQKFYNPAKGTYGIAGQVAGMYHLNAWVTAFGGFWYDDVTKQLGLNRIETKEGLKFFIKSVLRYMDVTDLGHDYQRRLFGEEKVPIYISGPWDVSFAVKTLGIENVAITPYPKIDGKTPKPWSGFRNLYISVMAEAGGKERTYANMLLVLYIALNDNALLTLVRENGYVPVKFSVAEYIRTHLGEHPVYKIVLGFYNQVLATVPMPKDKNMQIVWGADTYIQAVLQEYSNALGAGLSVEEAVEKAVGVVDAQLDAAYQDISARITS